MKLLGDGNHMYGISRNSYHFLVIVVALRLLQFVTRETITIIM